MKLVSAKLILGFLFALTTAASVADSRSEVHVQDSESVGGPHGDWFDDKSLPGANHKRIAYVTMYGCGPREHITMLEVGYRDNRDPKLVVSDHVLHGGQSELKTASLKLAKDEYINAVKVSTWKRKLRFYGLSYKARTRVGNIEVWTNQGHSVSCGGIWSDDPTIKLEPKILGGGALLYFSGRAGDSLDQIQAHWIPVADF